MPVTPPKAPESLDDGFRTRSIRLRNIDYVLKELDAETYEDCIKKSSDEDKMVDQAIMMRLMLDKSIVSPDMTVKQIFAQPYSVVRKLESIVNELHFTEAEEESADDGEDTDKGKAEG